MLFTELKRDFSLILSDFKKTLRKSMILEISAILESTEVRNNTINIHLPLMIFIRRHSQESQFDKKWLICSIKSHKVYHLCPNNHFLLIYPSCPISKRLYTESTTYDYVRSEPSHKNTQLPKLPGDFAASHINLQKYS